MRSGPAGSPTRHGAARSTPADLKEADFLAYYAGRLGAVEINNTFYRMPKESLLADWAARVPEAFTFVLKAPQKITHMKRLKDAGEEVGYFLRTANVLGPRLGPTLFQLPPNLKADQSRLRDFLAFIPRTWRAAFEFRHPSWLADGTYALLREHGAALVCAEMDAEESAAAPPLVPTASWGYLRLRRADYSAADLAAWAERTLAQPWDAAFVFFKHEDAGTGPRLAAEFGAIVNGRAA